MAQLAASPRARLSLALIALLVAAYAAALAARGGPRPVVARLSGVTGAGSPLELTVSDGRLTRIAVRRVPVRCTSGYRFAANVVGPATPAGGGLAGSARIVRRYPDGSEAATTEAVAHGSLARAGSASGTLAVAIELYAGGRAVDRCAAAPTSFSARV